MKNAIVTMSSTFWEKGWRRKEENCFLYTLIYFFSFYDIEVQNWLLNDSKEKTAYVEGVQKEMGTLGREFRRVRARRAREKD